MAPVRLRLLVLLALATPLAGCGGLSASKPGTTAEPSEDVFGSFEGSTLGWSALGANSDLSLTTTVHRFGRGAAKVTAVAAREYGIYTPNARANPIRGSVYRLSLWIAGLPQTVGPSVLIQLVESGGKRLDRVMAQRNVKLRRSWRYLTLTGVVTGGHRAAIHIYITQGHDVGPGDTFYVDNVVLNRP